MGLGQMSNVLDSIEKLTTELRLYKPRIVEALSYAGHTHTFDDVVVGVFQGRYKYIANPASFFITEVLDFPRQKHYHVFLAGGSLEDILANEYKLDADARDAGCSKITMAGRAGWRKALDQAKWQTAFTVMGRDVE